jgi:hypothetical protein
LVSSGPVTTGEPQGAAGSLISKRKQRDRMRTVVAVLNILSSLASLGMLCVGAYLVSVGLLSLKYHDYTPITLGLVLVAGFLSAPAVSVMSSTKLARQGSRWSILVSLAPVVLVVLTLVAAAVAIAILEPDD